MNPPELFALNFVPWGWLRGRLESCCQLRNLCHWGWLLFICDFYPNSFLCISGSGCCLRCLSFLLSLFCFQLEIKDQRSVSRYEEEGREQPTTFLRNCCRHWAPIWSLLKIVCVLSALRFFSYLLFSWEKKSRPASLGHCWLIRLYSTYEYTSTGPIHQGLRTVHRNPPTVR